MFDIFLRILNDWTFEKTVNSLVCTVYAFDPSVKCFSIRGHNIISENLGVASKKNETKLMDMLGNFLKKQNQENTKISYLKMDIECYEMTGLPNWLSNGALKNVKQVAVQVHLKKAETTIEFLKTIQRFCFEGDFRLISYEPNGYWYNLSHSKRFYYLFEIALKKLNQQHKIKQKNCHLLVP